MPEFRLGDLGPCQAYFKGVDLGKNTNVVVRMTDETAPVRTAQDGTASVDDVITGRMFEVEINLTRTTLAQLESILPGVEVVGDVLTFSNPVGVALSSIAGHLSLKRIIEGIPSTDATHHLVFFNAAPRSQAEWAFDAATQRVTKAIFRCYPAETVPSGETYSVGEFGAIGYEE